MTIEEKWAELDDSLSLDIRLQDMRDAMIALMLAVLDEAFAQPVLVDSIYVARRGVDALRTRIQELGKELEHGD